MPKLDITNANNVVEFHPQKAFFQVKNLGGPKGDKGDRGEPGAGLKITDTVATYQNLPTTLEYCDSGAAYFVRSDGQLYIWDGYEFPAEGHGAQFEGPQGPQGEPGRNGTDGRDGTDGTDGFSPEATVEQVGAGARITITDKDGTTTADVAGYEVDDALSDSSTNPVQNKVVKGALDGKQATLGAGDISTNLIADEAVTQAKLASGMEVGEVVYEYVQEAASSTDVPLTVALDFLTYKRFEVVAEYASAYSITAGSDRIWLYSGNTATSGSRCGVYMWSNSNIQTDMQTITNGESAVVHRSSLPNAVQHYMQIDRVVAGNDYGAAWRSKSQSATGFATLGGMFGGVDTIKYTLAKPAAGGVFRVIGYR